MDAKGTIQNAVGELKRAHLVKLKTKATEELKQCSEHLAEKNCWLMKDIQHTDDSTAKQARDLLHQYEVYQMRFWILRNDECLYFSEQMIEATTQTIDQNQLDMAGAELQEKEKTMEKNLGNETEKMGKAILEELEENAQLEQEETLQKAVEEVLLKQMVIDNRILQCEIITQREVNGLGESQHSKAEPATLSPCPL
ncbi:UNVERIFIED_CONTAM: hypothetical protein H355_007567 [Colinus virginianus]|nr:hypothetical protein H355_007567 [Colinus virginianus]